MACSFQTMHTSLYNELQLSNFDNTNKHVSLSRKYIPCEFMNNANWRRVVDNLHYTCIEVMNDQNDIN